MLTQDMAMQGTKQSTKKNHRDGRQTYAVICTSRTRKGLNVIVQQLPPQQQPHITL
jgi:hypothetical protein